MRSSFSSSGSLTSSFPVSGEDVYVDASMESAPPPPPDSSRSASGSPPRRRSSSSRKLTAEAAALFRKQQQQQLQGPPPPLLTSASSSTTPSPSSASTSPPPSMSGLSSNSSTAGSLSLASSSCANSSSGSAITHAPAGEGIKVGIRMRPLNARERKHGCVWKVIPEHASITQTTTDGLALGDIFMGSNFFTFDQTFDENSSSRHVYEHMAQDIVGSFVAGYHGTIFAYGQTSSGKTYTMQGSGSLEEGSLDSNKGGIVHMAASDIFQHIRLSTAQRRFEVRVSFLEVYNEDLRDLLSADTSRIIPIREDPRRGVFVQATEHKVENVEELLTVLFKGEKARAFGATAMNERSSRSHAIFRIMLESRPLDTSDLFDANGELNPEKSVIVSTLNLVDLAGSESVRLTGADGLRQKEGGRINQSLLSLSRVIVALGSNQPHVNYRDSKLTRILQPSLTGNARMAVICCATPSQLYLEETRSTLQFAARAKRVKTNPKVNEMLDDGAMMRAKLKELMDQVGVLEQENGRLQVQHEETSRQLEVLHMEKKRDRKHLASSSEVHRLKRELKLAMEEASRLKGELREQQHLPGLPRTLRGWITPPRSPRKRRSSKKSSKSSGSKSLFDPAIFTQNHSLTVFTGCILLLALFFNFFVWLPARWYVASQDQCPPLPE